MSMVELDELDYGILHLLQADARNQTPVDMADDLPVSAQTVRNRIQNLEDEGVIQGYVPVIDYEKAGFPIRLKFSCTAPVHRRRELAEKALDIPNVVRVDEMMTARENLRPLAITEDTDEITPITEELVDLGLTIESERLVQHRHAEPFDHFGESVFHEE